MAQVQPITGSSSISGAGYDPETETLTITFVGVRSYDYHNLPQSIYDGLMAADSAGRYFNTHIRGVYG
jgi:hypothetical protein